MKRGVLLGMFMMVATMLTAQVQQCYVKTLGRPNHAGVPLEGVTVRVGGVVNALVSGADGRFTIVMPDRKDGDALKLVSVRKVGYELRDRESIARQYVFSSRVPLQIVMVNQQELAADKQRIERNAYRVAEKNFKKKMAELEEQRQQQAISADEYRQRRLELQQGYEKFTALISDMADRYARTDYDGLDSIDREINICIEEGEMDRADSLIRTVFDPSTVLERNRQAKAEIEERLRMAQLAIDRALADRQRLSRDSAYALEMAQNLELLAAEYKLQGDVPKARHCYEQSLEILVLLYGEQSRQAATTREEVGKLKD